MMVVVGDGDGGSGQPAADGQPGSSGNNPGRRRNGLPMMSRRYCLNFQPGPVGNGYCPDQFLGCTFIHKNITDPSDVAIAQNIADSIRARAARREAEGQNVAGEGQKRKW